MRKAPVVLALFVLSLSAITATAKTLEEFDAALERIVRAEACCFQRQTLLFVDVPGRGFRFRRTHQSHGQCGQVLAGAVQLDRFSEMDESEIAFIDLPPINPPNRERISNRWWKRH